VFPVASVLLRYILITHFLFYLFFKAVEFLGETLRLFTRLNNFLSHYSIVLNIGNLLFYFLYIDILSLLSKDLGVLSFTNLRTTIRIPNNCLSDRLYWQFKLTIAGVNTLLIFFCYNPLLNFFIDFLNIRLTFLLDFNHFFFCENSAEFFVDFLDVNIITTRLTIRFDKLLQFRIRLCNGLFWFLDRNLELTFAEELGQTLRQKFIKAVLFDFDSFTLLSPFIKCPFLRRVWMWLDFIFAFPGVVVLAFFGIRRLNFCYGFFQSGMSLWRTITIATWRICRVEVLMSFLILKIWFCWKYIPTTILLLSNNICFFDQRSV